MHDENGTQRAIVWDEENRIQSVTDGGQEVAYKYDHSGNREIKSSSQGETAYVNQYFVIRNGSVASKHFFAGSSRIASKMVMQEGTSIKTTLAGSTRRAVREKPVEPGKSQEEHGTGTAKGQEGNTHNDPACDGPGTSKPARCVTNPPAEIPPVTETSPGSSGNNGGGNNPAAGGNGKPSSAKGPEEKEVYFYHPDHLGSTSM
jgi:YD repeat-containing protein